LASTNAIQFNYAENFAPNDKIVTSGGATFSLGAIVLTGRYVQQVGIGYYKDKVQAHLGFNTSFAWRPYECMLPLNEGFTFFLTQDPPTASLVPGEGLGIKHLHNTYMVGYSAQYNEFYICNWTAPLTASFRQVCNVSNSLSTYSCSSGIVNFDIKYFGDTNTIELYANGQLRHSAVMPIDFNDGYYAGFSASTGAGYIAQEIRSWSFNSDDLEAVNAFNGYHRHYPLVANFATFGSAKIASNGHALQLTNRQSEYSTGAVIYSAPLLVHYGFKTSFVWTPSKCEGDGYDGDGFSFFLTKNQPSLIPVSLSTGIGLGVQYLTSVVMIAYNAQYNEFYVCKWGSTSNAANFRNFCSAVFPYPHARLSCGHNFTIGVNYAGSTLKVSVDETHILSHAVALDRVHQFVGISGSINGGLFEQRIDNWRFYNSLPAATQFNLPRFNSTSDIFMAGSAVMVGTAIQLTNNFNHGGLFAYSKLVRAGLGFSTTFVWNATNCGGDFLTGGDGFGFFITKDFPHQSRIQGGAGLGVQNLPDASVVAYSIIKNEFYVCNWIKPDLTKPLSGLCYVFPNPNPAYTCNSAHEFTIKFDGAGVKVLRYSSELFSAPLYRSDFKGLYYIGFAGGTGSVYLRQTIESWSFSGLI
jgi:hypothetical protein